MFGEARVSISPSKDHLVKKKDLVDGMKGKEYPAVASDRVTFQVFPFARRKFKGISCDSSENFPYVITKAISHIEYRDDWRF